MRIQTTIKRRVRRALFGLVPLALASSLVDAAMLWGLRYYVDQVQSGVDFLRWWLLAMLLVLALRWWAGVNRQRVSERLVLNLEVYLRLWLQRLGRRLPSTWFHQRHYRRHLRAAEEAVRTLLPTFSGLFALVFAVAQLVVFLPVLLWLSWKLTLILLVLVLPLLSLLQKQLRLLGGDLQGKLAQQAERGLELRQYFELGREWTLRADLQAMAQQAFTQVRNLYQRGRAISLRQSWVVHSVDALAALAVVLVFVLCGWWIGQGVMQPQELLLYGAALLLCYKPVKDSIRMVPLVREGQVALQILQDLEQQFTGKINLVRAKSSACNKNDSMAVVRCQNLSFEWWGETTVPVFENLNLTLDPSQALWIKGVNGRGKTTLLRLLAGLEKPQKGEIIWPAQTGEIAFFSQKDFLLPVEYVRSQWETRYANLPAGLRHLVDLLVPGGLPNRQGFSAGQLQRLGLAWVFMSGAQVWLLDEPLAFVAAKDRRAILQQMQAAAQKQGVWLVLSSHELHLNEDHGFAQILDLDAL